jgi:hypothetical protein
VVTGRGRAGWSALLPAVAAVAVAALLPGGALLADQPTEYQVKAAFLFNFAKYVDFPKGTFRDASAPIVIGVLGSDPFGRALDEALEGKAIDGRRLVARRFDDAQSARAAQIVFIAASEEGHLPRVLDALSGASVMTVGDVEHFAERGGVAGFYDENNRVRVCINVTAAAKADLKISSQLLKLARIVNDEGK